MFRMESALVQVKIVEFTLTSTFDTFNNLKRISYTLRYYSFNQSNIFPLDLWARFATLSNSDSISASTAGTSCTLTCLQSDVVLWSETQRSWHCAPCSCRQCQSHRWQTLTASHTESKIHLWASAPQASPPRSSSDRQTQQREKKAQTHSHSFIGYMTIWWAHFPTTRSELILLRVECLPKCPWATHWTFMATLWLTLVCHQSVLNTCSLDILTKTK